MFKQEEIALWTGVEGNGSIHDGDGTSGHGLTVDIGKGLRIRDGMCYECIAHLDNKASEQVEGKTIIDQCLRRWEKANEPNTIRRF